MKIKSQYYLQLLATEIVKLLGSNEQIITKDKNGENVPQHQINEVVIIHGNIVNNQCEHDPKFLSTFASSKSVG